MQTTEKLAHHTSICKDIKAEQAEKTWQIFLPQARQVPSATLLVIPDAGFVKIKKPPPHV
jgi:hypothetical protein